MKAKSKNKFANAIIIVCILISVIVTAAVLYEYHRLDTVIPSAVLGVLFGFWGGELLIIAIRQIFGSDITRKSSKTSNSLYHLQENILYNKDEENIKGEEYTI